MLAAKAELGIDNEASVNTTSKAIRFIVGSYLSAGELNWDKKIVVSIIAAGVIGSHRDSTTLFSTINIINHG
jgi:hypothetical protein